VWSFDQVFVPMVSKVGFDKQAVVWFDISDGIFVFHAIPVPL
jgi:hypothetical protein